MPLKATTDNASGFFIWFDINNKKEYYATPMNHYYNNIVNSKNSKYRHIFYNPHFYVPKTSPKRNQAAYNKHFIQTMLLDMDHPFEEQLGRILINFINCRLDKYEYANKDFFCLYGFELLNNPNTNNKVKKNFRLKIDYENSEEFKRITKKYFEASRAKLTHLQNQFRDCINYAYNLNKDSEDEKYNCITKFQAYAIKNNMIKYSENVEILYNTSSIFKNDFEHVKLSDINKLLNKDEISLQTSNKYSSTELSSILFIVLNELVNNDISIKICKNCGRYFIPLHRHAEVYCDLPPEKFNDKTCRELGARTTYNKAINDVEGLLIYRRTYQKRLMQIKRHPDISGKDVSRFHNWREKAQAKIKAYKKGNLTEDELATWMKNNKDL